MAAVIHREIIRGIMTPLNQHSPTVVQQGQSPSKAYNTIRRNPIHHLPVLNQDRLVGIVSATDFLRAMYNNINIHSDLILLDKNFSTIIDMLESIGGSVGSGIITIQDTDTVHEAANKLTTGNFHSLPVVNNENNLVGIVTSTDLIDYLHEHSR